MEKNTTRKLRRTRDGRMIAGVCSGAARYLDVDANILRLALAVLTVFTAGTGIGVYVIAWLLIPEEDAQTSIAEDLVEKGKESPVVQDAVRKAKDAVGKNRSQP